MKMSPAIMVRIERIRNQIGVQLLSSPAQLVQPLAQHIRQRRVGQRHPH
jgi:hypothetical protein